MSPVHEGQTKSNKERLFGTLNSKFSEDELRDICAQLKINYDTIPGATQEAKLKLLVTHLDQHPHKVRVLVGIIKAMRTTAASNGDDTQQTTVSEIPSEPPATNTPPPPSPSQTNARPADAPPPSPTEPEPYIPPRPKFDYKQFGIPFGLGIVFMLFLLGLGVFPGFGTTIVEVTREVAVAQEVEVTRVVEVTRLVESLQEVEVTRLVEEPENRLADNPNLPLARSDEETENDVVEATAAPTAPPQPTPTALIRPTTELFTDDFERGLSPEWLPVYGSMGMSNGNLTVISPFDGVSRNHLVILDAYLWENYILTAHIASMESTGQNSLAYGGILVRELDNGQWAGVLIQPSKEGIAFAIFNENGDYAIQSGSLVDGYEKDFSLRHEGAELRVEAYGNAYILYLDGQKITSATFEGSTASRIALWAQNSAQKDDSDRYAPRFEDIRIESAP